MIKTTKHTLEDGKITKKIAQEAFDKLVSESYSAEPTSNQYFAIHDLDSLLMNWHTGAELSSDEDKIKVYESWGGRATPSTSYEEPTKFIEWLIKYSLDPRKMDIDDEWMDLVKRARKVAGI